MSENSLDSLEGALFDALVSDDEQQNSHLRKRKTTEYPAEQINSTFSQLTDICILNMLARLSPEDLTCLAQTNRYFRSIASDSLVWRGLYHARWPAGPSDDQSQHATADWKTLYMQRDTTEFTATHAADASLREIYIRAHRARRAEPLSSEQANNLFIDSSRGKPELFDHIAAFRRESETRARTTNNKTATNIIMDAHAAHDDDGGDDTFRRASSLRPTSSDLQEYIQNPKNQCQGRCNWVPLNNTPHFICQYCYHVHVCGENMCTEGQIADQSGQLVCTITGRCFQRLLTDAEENGIAVGGGLHSNTGGGTGGGGGEISEDGGDWNAVEEGMGGRLGRAFFAGYNADEREMLLRFGVQL